METFRTFATRWLFLVFAVGLLGTPFSLHAAPQSVAPTNVITFSSVTHNFGTVPAGTSTSTTGGAYGVQVTNSGTAAYPFALSITGGFANLFSEKTNCGTSLAAGKSCEIIFNFQPAAAGSFSATWSLAPETGFTYSPSNGGTLSGAGVSGSGSVSLTTCAHNFGTLLDGTTSSTYGVVLTNSTASAVTLSATSVSAPFAQMINCTSPLAAGASCNAQFTFTPTAPGTTQQTFGISVNSGATPISCNGSTATGITLTGTGTNTFTISPNPTALSPSAQTTFTTSPAEGGITWAVNGIAGGNSSVGTITSGGVYTAPATTTAVTSTISATVGANKATATAYTIPGGTFTALTPYVEGYTISLPAGAEVAVNFGQTTSYGLNTWKVAAPNGGGSTTVEVAGMIAGTPYHFQGVVSLPGGITFTDAAHQITTAGLTAANFPTMTISVNDNPSPGIEMTDNISYATVPMFATDLDGNVIWAYEPGDLTAGDLVDPVKPLPNGHLLVLIGQNSGVPLTSGVPAGALQVIREIDLAGNIIRQVTIAQIQTNLTTAGYTGPAIQTIHHEVTVTPAGHWLVLSNTVHNISGTNALGDQVIDIDPNNNFKVDWYWDEWAVNDPNFLNTNRRPWMWPDWTHSNAIIYSADDGNIVVSSRHQNWLMKLDYQNGAGDGHVIWYFGAQGSFTLENSTTDQDWNYAQHGPSFFSPNTTGVFDLALMDNGDDRGTYEGAICSTGSNPACYSTVPIFQVNENNLTVTKIFPDKYPTTDYSFFGGNSDPLANGNLEADFASNTTIQTTGSMIVETSTGSSPTVAWKMLETGELFYRAFRMTSLYPGVSWPEGAGISEVSRNAHRLQDGEKPAEREPMGPTPQM